MTGHGGVHHAAAQGYAAAADAYARGRPDYPDAVAGWLRDIIGLTPGRDAIEIGAGTGKFLPLLLATGANVVALEPVPAMRAEIARAHPNVESIAGTAESVPAPDASFDAVLCAQSFHWFATSPALAEMRRVLRPGGMLALVWNVRDETVPWVAALSRILAPHEHGTPRYRTGDWRRPFPAPGLAAADERSAPHAHRGPAARVVLDRTLSVSFIAALPPAQREDIARQVRALIAATPELAGGGTVAFPYVTRMYAFRRD